MMRATLAERPDLALRVAVHAAALAVIHRQPFGGVVRAPIPGSGLDAGVPGVEASPAAGALAATLGRWHAILPCEPDALWAWIEVAPQADILALFAACVGAGADAGAAEWTTAQGADLPAARVAVLASLNPAAWWTPTREAYLDRVPKALVAEAVREGAGEPATRGIAGAKKDAMAKAAAGLLAGTGWVPPMLRVPADRAGMMPLAAE